MGAWEDLLAETDDLVDAWTPAEISVRMRWVADQQLRLFTDMVDQAHEVAATTSVYKTVRAKALLSSNAKNYGEDGKRLPAVMHEAHADQVSADDYERRLAAEAIWEALKSRERILRSVSDLLRSEAVTAREVVGGHGTK